MPWMAFHYVVSIGEVGCVMLMNVQWQPRDRLRFLAGKTGVNDIVLDASTHCFSRPVLLVVATRLMDCPTLHSKCTARTLVPTLWTWFDAQCGPAVNPR